MTLLLPIAIPVDPDAPEARRLLVDELAKPVYEASRPTWFDELSQSFWDWLQSLFGGRGADLGGLVPLVVVVAVVVVLLVALLIYGIPRLRRRSERGSELFGDDEGRTAAELRAAAGAAASSGDWATAIIERYRAIARALSDRTVVTVLPGTTADEFARTASAAFPDRREALFEAALVFDEVRYLDREGSERSYLAVAALDDHLGAMTPVRLEAPTAAGIR